MWWITSHAAKVKIICLGILLNFIVKMVSPSITWAWNFVWNRLALSIIQGNLIWLWILRIHLLCVDNSKHQWHKNFSIKYQVSSLGHSTCSLCQWLLSLCDETWMYGENMHNTFCWVRPRLSKCLLKIILCKETLSSIAIVTCKKCMSLGRLASVRDLVLGRQLMCVLLKLFSFAVNVKVNRQELIRPELNTVNIMLGALNLVGSAFPCFLHSPPPTHTPAYGWLSTGLHLIVLIWGWQMF